MAGYQEEEFTIQFAENISQQEHMHQDVELIFVIDGRVRVSMLEKQFDLGEEDVMVVNSNHRHGIYSLGNSHVCLIRLNYFALLKYQDKKILFFYCNSTVEKNDKYNGLRIIMGNLLSECAVNMDKMTFMKKSQLYRLLHYLSRYFMTDTQGESQKGEDVRTEKMLQYINANYAKPLTLAEMADLMYMAPSSFSRYFKKRVGMTFIEYVNNVRLHFALEDIRYTDKSIAWIAQNHGFANSSVFCRAFKELYGMSPMVYRRQGHVEKALEGASLADQSFLEKYVQGSDTQVWNPWKKNHITARANAGQREPFDNIWGKAVNLGLAEKLLSAVLQSQIASARRDLAFTYGRVIGILSETMLLRPGHEPFISSFDTLDTVFDFLVEEGICPIVSLDNKPYGIKKSINEDVVERRSEKIFETMEECLGVIDSLVSHLISRYGLREVKKWIFECWYDEYYENTMGVPGIFTDHFSAISRCIHRRLPHARIGGCGLSTAISPEKFRRLIQRWRASDEIPAFVSIYLLPYERADIDGRLHGQRRLNTAAMEDVTSCRTIMAEEGWDHMPLYVTEWNMTISQRNYFNDTCGKAALMADQMIRLLGQISLAAYDVISDFSGSYYDSSRLLIGAWGLITRAGIYKPSFYALTFMQMLGPYLLGTFENGIITAGERSEYIIFCYNHKQMKYNYYMRDEYDFDLPEVQHLFEDEESLDISFVLEGVENGEYLIRQYNVSPVQGSVLEEWEHLGLEEPLSLENIQYLKKRCIPCQKNSHIRADGGKLEFMETLKAHEIRLIKITRK